MSDFQVVEVPLTTWKVTSMCRKLLFQVVHETNFLRLNERPKKCPKSKLQCLMRCCNHLPNQYKLNPLHPFVGALTQIQLHKLLFVFQFQTINPMNFCKNPLNTPIASFRIIVLIMFIISKW
jgi:hypothetical protein